MATPDTVSFGYEQVPAGEKTAMVGEVFSRVARKYDIMNDAMSGGMHRLWKDRFVRRVKPREGETILDMAGGTGDIAFRMAESGAAITVADINPDMLAVGIDRAAKRGIDGLVWTEANAETLQFPDRFFDAYTIAFGIRNVTDISAALKEALRVLRRGGRLFEEFLGAGVKRHGRKRAGGDSSRRFPGRFRPPAAPPPRRRPGGSRPESAWD